MISLRRLKSSGKTKMNRLKQITQYWRKYYTSRNYQGAELEEVINSRLEEGMEEIKKNMDSKKNYSHWAKRKDRFYPTLITHDTLPSAVYETREDSDGNTYLREIAFPSDELILIPGT